MQLLQLWLPIILSAVGVFFASSLIHMVFKWHNSEYKALPNDEAVRKVLNEVPMSPGLYSTPHCVDMKEMQSEQMQKKFQDGPIALITLRRAGPPEMGKYLAQWFVLNIAIAALGGLLALQTMGIRANPHYAGHFIGLFTAIVYGAGSVQESIWMGRPWSATFKNILDALIYGAVTAVVFWQLWPTAVQ